MKLFDFYRPFRIHYQCMLVNVQVVLEGVGFLLPLSGVRWLLVRRVSRHLQRVFRRFRLLSRHLRRGRRAALRAFEAIAR